MLTPKYNALVVIADYLNAYRVMWIMVFFDLPTQTKKEMKQAALFRKRLIEDGFNMFQFSIYLRHCASKENADVHEKRVKSFLPESGKIGILCITDKQFENMHIFYGKKADKKRLNSDDGPIQLELF